ncbi:MAG: EAL domain-containing protein (putative c-di-GMP-specific phosphodiesterase class I) [Gammaproteobacteria bacterium]|jgi:EAL domain-containing protein (putative c-di-GMP-specific phosphodiesterase class I)/GGDEF domain-containing protein
MSDNSTLDPGTGLLHRAAFLKEVRDAQIGSQNKKRTGCLLVLHFPGLLDIAHDQGQRVAATSLKNLLAVIETRLRGRDTLGRIGAQSLCLLLRYCIESDAIIIADQYEALLNDVAFDEKLQQALAGFHYRIVALDSHNRHSRPLDDGEVNTRALSEASVLLSTIQSLTQVDLSSSDELVSIEPTTTEQRESLVMDTLAQSAADSDSVANEKAELSAQSWRLKPGHLLNPQFLATCYRVQPVGFANTNQSLPENPMFNAALDALALNLKQARPAIESQLILPVDAAQLTNEAGFWLKERCRRQRIAPSDICLLLSVKSVSRDLRTCMPILRRLNRQGIRLMLEGVSSAPQFTALQNLAGFDYLWISAKSLQGSIRDMQKRQELEALVDAAHAQHREVCAAGVDSQALLEHAQALRIDVGFGRMCGRSLPFPELPKGSSELGEPPPKAE